MNIYIYIPTNFTSKYIEQNWHIEKIDSHIFKICQLGPNHHCQKQTFHMKFLKSLGFCMSRPD